MPWMSKYLRCISVRLGVILIAGISLTTLGVFSVLLFVYDMKLFDPLLKPLQSDGKISDDTLLGKLIQMKDNSETNNLFLWIQGYLATHAVANLLGLYGAYELEKHFLWPMIIFEFLRILLSISFNILLMPIVNELLSLTLAIIYESICYFLILFLCYNWAACIALFQILVLINDERYRNLYGDDPLRPHFNNRTENLQRGQQQKQQNNKEDWIATTKDDIVLIPNSYDPFHTRKSMIQNKSKEQSMIRWIQVIDEQPNPWQIHKY